MDAINDQQPDAVDPQISLIRGGPAYRAQQASRLILPNEWNNVRRVVFAIAVGWLPLILITALFHPDSLLSLLKDYRVHSRMLVAIPVLLFGQVLLEARFRMVVSQIRKADLLNTADFVRMDDIIAMVLRLRDSLFPELAILLLLIIRSVTAFRGLVDDAPWLEQGTGVSLHFTPAGWYAVLVSAALFQFLLGLTLWKWLLWTLFAFRLSRLKLKLAPTHADGHGGLGFLGLTPIAFAPVAFASATVIGATWRYQILHDGAQLMSFKLPAIAFVVIIAVIALAPLLFFVPRLVRLRKQGILEYGILAQMQTFNFNEKWIRGRTGHETEFFTAPEINSLGNFSHTYRRIERLNPFPADKEAFVALALSVAVPLLPMILAAVPLVTVLKVLLKALH